MKKCSIWFVTLGFLIAVRGLIATEWQPWSEVDLQIYPKIAYTYQHYNTIQSSSGSQHITGNDHFYSLGVSGSYAVWRAELEAVFADTRHRSFGFDNFKITGCYQWLDDIVGDPISLTTGLSLDAASETALKDISSFHHGRNEAEAFVSIGKERPSMDYWVYRWWGALGFGVGDHGSPWLRGRLAWENNFQRSIQLRLFLHALHGLGGNSLALSKSFQGYGSIAHRSVDLGARLSKVTDFWGIFRLEYAHRIYARNFPKNAFLLQFSYIYPFGL